MMRDFDGDVYDAKTMTAEEWSFISQIVNLSEDFIHEFQDKVDWYDISESQKLSESFIREFQSKVCWDKIFKFQILSRDFVEEFTGLTSDKVFMPFTRPSITFTRDIKSLHPTSAQTEKYLKIWGRDEEVKWNEFLDKCHDHIMFESIADHIRFVNGRIADHIGFSK